jgi:hypothetical protein
VLNSNTLIFNADGATFLFLFAALKMDDENSSDEDSPSSPQSNQIQASMSKL